MSQLSQFISCPNVQLSLAEAFDYDNNRMEMPGLLAFILSGMNRNGVVQNQINFRDHGRRAVEVVYDQRFLESWAEATGRASCGSWGRDGETSQTYSISPSDGFRAGFSLYTSEIEERCQDDELYIAKRINKLIDVLTRRMGTKAAVDVLANIGNFASDVDAGNAPGTTTQINGATKLSNGGIDYDLLEAIAFQNESNFEGGTPNFTFGGELLWKYIKAIGAATESNTQTGLAVGRYAEASGVTFGYDRRVQTNASNAADLVSLIPGAVQMISFNEFKGILDLETDTEVYGTLEHPMFDQFPVTFDYRAQFTCDDSGGRRWDFELATNHDFIFLPSDMYQAGDRLEGVNGITSYRIVNP